MKVNAARLVSRSREFYRINTNPRRQLHQGGYLCQWSSLSQTSRRLIRAQAMKNLVTEVIKSPTKDDETKDGYLMVQAH